MAAKSGRLGRVYITAFTATTSTQEPAAISTDGMNITITDTGHRRLDPTFTDLKVFRGVGTGQVEIGSSHWNVDYGLGVINFTTPRPTTAVFRADIAWFSIAHIGNCFSWQLDARVDMLDVTAFSTSATNVTWRSFLPSLRDATVTLGRFANPTTGDKVSDRLIANNTPYYLELMGSYDEDHKWVCYGRVAQDQFTADVGDTPKETVTFIPTGPVWQSSG